MVLETVYFEPGIYKVKTQLDGQISLVFMEVDKIKGGFENHNKEINNE